MSGPGEIHNLNGYTAETTVNFLDKNYFYTRLELVDKDDLLRAADRAKLGITQTHPSFRIGAYTFGGVRDVWNNEKFRRRLAATSLFIPHRRSSIAFTATTLFRGSFSANSSSQDDAESQRSQLGQTNNLIVKSPPHLEINLPWFGEVRPAECIGTVQQETPVRYIYGLQCDQPVFAKVFAERNIERRMARQMIRAVAIEEAGPIANIPGDIAA